MDLAMMGFLSCLLNSEKQESTNYLQCFFCPFGDHSISAKHHYLLNWGTYCVIHTNYFMGAVQCDVHSFFSFSFFEGAMLIGPSSNFLGTLGTPH
jgi:hypothetical protein